MQRKVGDYKVGTDPTFDKAIPLLLNSEGGFVCHPKDPGGATNMGITIGVAQMLNLDENHDGVVDRLDIKQLSKSTATSVYYSEYWLKAHCNELPPKLAYMTFDAAVNLGTSRAIRLLQTSLSLSPDGVFGPLSRASVVSAKQIDVMKKLKEARASFYQRLLAQNQHLETFRNGWLNRNTRVADDALRLF